MKRSPGSVKIADHRFPRIRKAAAWCQKSHVFPPFGQSRMPARRLYSTAGHLAAIRSATAVTHA